MKRLQQYIFVSPGALKLLVASCTLVWVTAGYLSAADDDEQDETKAKEAAVVETVKDAKKTGQKELDKVDKIITQGKALAREAKFAEAVGYFQKAQSQLEQLNGEMAKQKLRSLNTYLNNFRSRWSDAIMDKARASAVAGKYEEAINTASEASLADPGKNDLVTKFIDRCKTMQDSREFRDKTTLKKFDPQSEKTAIDINQLLREAVVLFQNKKYIEVRNKLEKVFLADPHNLQAMELLNKTYDKLYEYALKRRQTDVEEMLAMNSWYWNETVMATQLERAVTGGATVKSNVGNSIYEKMENIIFPSVEFDDADIYSVIRYLNKTSKRYDPDKEGISIVSGFTRETANALPKITMSFAKIPMSEVLRYLCKGVGLKYKIDEGAIIIGTGVDEMQTEYFPIRGDLISDITGIKTDETAAAAPAKEKFLGVGGTTITKDGLTKDDDKERKPVSLTSVALIKYFTDRGISFGEGATIAYDRGSGKLIVKNSLENLRRLDELLRQLDLIKTPLVMVEAKIVEINQVDVEELGFDWMFNVPYSPTSPSTDHPNWWINEVLGQNQQGNPVRHYTPTDPNATQSTPDNRNYKVINDLRIFPNFQGSAFGDTQVNMDLTVNAISQNSRSEVLSTPRLLTTSGSEASIRMVESTTFPTSWDNPAVTVNGATVSITAPIPQFGEATDIGILFTIRPVVNPDNYTITLHLVPQVVTFAGKNTETVSIQTGTVDAQGVAKTTSNNTYDIWMPMIGRRDLDVNVKVYDGETIVLGGMVDNRSMYRDDKWPIIGEVPLVGRLFSSQLAFTEKVNLLIFVTTRLVNNDGIPVRKNKQRAVADFYR